MLKKANNDLDNKNFSFCPDCGEADFEEEDEDEPELEKEFLDELVFKFVQSPKQANSFGLYRNDHLVAIVGIYPEIDGDELMRQLCYRGKDDNG